MALHRFLLRVALAGVQAFAWVFVFHVTLAHTGDVSRALLSAALLYALSHIATIFLTPLSARVLSYGAKKMLAYGSLALIAALVVWGAAFAGYAGVFMDEALVAGALLFGAFRALYTVPYTLIREVGAPISIAAELALALVPAAAGFLLASEVFPPSQILFAAAVIAMCSLAPLARLPEYRERFAWRYKTVFGELFERRERRLVLPAIARGVESAALMFLWPIVVFIALLSYAALGLVMTASLLAVLSVRLARRRFPVFGPLPFSHAATASSGWILRLAAFEPMSLVLTSTYGSLAAPEDLGSIASPESAENSTYVDERTALKEVAHSFGGLALALFVALASSILPLSSALIAAFTGVALVAGGAAYYRHVSVQVRFV